MSDSPNKNASPTQSDQEISTSEMPLTTLVTRSAFGGVLMGLANLVPGISGGTMLLAAGIYPRFIEAIAQVTRFKFNLRSLLLLVCIAGSAGAGILLLAGVLKDLVIERRWVMYSLFIGLTLGGVPVVWRLAKRADASLILSALGSFGMMIGLALLQFYGVVGSGPSNFLMSFLAGLAGASAMILPGVSGGYLLLLMGQYVPILSAIDQFKDALKARDITVAMDPALSVLLPVAIGVVVGIVLVGNLLQWLFRRHQQATLGVLLGLLLGSTIGLYPFQTVVAPVPGDQIKGQVVTELNVEEFDQEDWPTEYFRPTILQAGASTLLTLIGFGITIGIARIGNEEPENKSPQSDH